jgi:hypothetical protein
MASGFLERRLTDGVRAASQGLFPENDLGAPDWRDTEMVRRTLAYIEELPPTQRRMLVFLFVFVELAAPLLLLTPRRFSKLSPEQRAAAVRGWRKSRFYLLRLLGDALKASTTMMYMSHPRVVAHIEEYRICEHSADALDYPLRPSELAGMAVPE